MSGRHQNVPSHTVVRRHHAALPRPSHVHSSHKEPNRGIEEDLSQTTVDGVTNPGDIRPGSVGVGLIADGGVIGTSLADGIRSGVLQNWATFGETVEAWFNWSGSGVLSSEPVSDGQSGNRVLRVTGGMGWLIGTDNVRKRSKSITLSERATRKPLQAWQRASATLKQTSSS